MLGTMCFSCQTSGYEELHLRSPLKNSLNLKRVFCHAHLYVLFVTYSFYSPNIEVNVDGILEFDF